MNIPAAASQVVSQCLQPSVHRATKFLSPKFTVKATRIGKFDARSRTQHFVLTVGAPNFSERVFIQACKRAGESIPVRKVQLKMAKKTKPRKRTRRPGY